MGQYLRGTGTFQVKSRTGIWHVSGGIAKSMIKMLALLETLFLILSGYVADDVSGGEKPG